MTARTAFRLHKFTDATLSYAHCQLLWAKALTQMNLDQEGDMSLDKSLVDLDTSYENLKSAKAMLFDALSEDAFGELTDKLAWRARTGGTK